MQLLIFPGFHSPNLTHDFLQALLPLVNPERLWVWPIGTGLPGVPWLLSGQASAPRRDRPLHVIAFSAGVVAAYPLVMAWNRLGGVSRLIAVDGWGMPLPGDLIVYRVSHDPWTHRTTYFPSAAESEGYFYADPAVDHLALWQSPQATQGMGAVGSAVGPMTALDFIGAVLASPDPIYI